MIKLFQDLFDGCMQEACSLGLTPKIDAGFPYIRQAIWRLSARATQPTVTCDMGA